MQIQISANTSQAQALFAGLRSQLPFAAAKTLTAIAKDVQDAVKKALPVEFDRPTPFTVRGVFYKPAQKGSSPAAEVYFPQSQAQSGRAEREYIRPGAQGAGARNQKKTEYLLSKMGFMPAGWVSTPGRYIMNGKLDAFGNMPGSYYKQIIRNLQIKNTKGPPKPVSGASARRAARLGVENEFFAVPPGANRLAKGGGWLPPGVYRRTGAGGKTLVQYLKFVRKASYRQRLDMPKIAVDVIGARAQQRWNETVQQIAKQYSTP